VFSTLNDADLPSLPRTLQLGRKLGVQHPTSYHPDALCNPDEDRYRVNVEVSHPRPDEDVSCQDDVLGFLASHAKEYAHGFDGHVKNEILLSSLGLQPDLSLRMVPPLHLDEVAELEL